MGKESLNRSDFISLASLARAFSEHYGDLGVALDVVATRVAENGAGILCLDDDGKPCRFVQEGHSDQAQFLYDLFRRADALANAITATTEATRI